MALKGAGDPRWVVRERDDGRNVNGWHWEDKDVTEWAKDRLEQLISTELCSTPHPLADVAVDSVTSVEGDATLYNRKGILKVLYDLKIVGKWSSLQPDPADRTQGEFKFELFDEEPDIAVTMNSKTRAVPELKHAFVTNVIPVIRTQCQVFIREMHAGAGQSLDGVSIPEKKTSTETKSSSVRRARVEEIPSTKSTSTELTELRVEDIFNCNATDMYLALTDRARLEAITRKKAVSEATVGGSFNLQDGAVSGRYTKLLIGKEVCMDWKLRGWGNEAAEGKATVKLSESEGKTRVEVYISGIPKDERSKTEGFWRLEMFRPIKVVMGWGSASQFL